MPRGTRHCDRNEGYERLPALALPPMEALAVTMNWEDVRSLGSAEKRTGDARLHFDSGRAWCRRLVGCWCEPFELLPLYGSSAYLRGGREAVEVVALCVETFGEVGCVGLLLKPVVNDRTARGPTMLEPGSSPVEAGVEEGDLLVEPGDGRSDLGLPSLLGVDLPLRPYLCFFSSCGALAPSGVVLGDPLDPLPSRPRLCQLPYRPRHGYRTSTTGSGPRRPAARSPIPRQSGGRRRSEPLRRSRRRTFSDTTLGNGHRSPPSP